MHILHFMHILMCILCIYLCIKFSQQLLDEGSIFISYSNSNSHISGSSPTCLRTPCLLTPFSDVLQVVRSNSILSMIFSFCCFDTFHRPICLFTPFIGQFACSHLSLAAQQQPGAQQERDGLSKLSDWTKCNFVYMWISCWPSLISASWERSCIFSLPATKVSVMIPFPANDAAVGLEDSYCIVSNCGQSRINTWSRLVAGIAMYVSVINARSRKNARCGVWHT